MKSPRPLVPFPTNVGLAEKRLEAFSPLLLTQEAEHKGIWYHSADTLLEVDDEVSEHKNNAEDPGSVTLNITDNADFYWLFNRDISDTLTLNDFAHVSLEGYHPPGGVDLSQYEAVFLSDAVVGQPVYVAGDGQVDLAACNNSTTYEVVGLAYSNTLTGFSGTVLTDGSVEKSDWTPITGTANLTPGELYFLDSTVGKLTATAPSAGGSYVVRVGRALTTKKLDIEISIEVLL